MFPVPCARPRTRPTPTCLCTLFCLFALLCLTVTTGAAATRRHAPRRKSSRVRQTARRQTQRDGAARRERGERKHFDESSAGLEGDDENGQEVEQREQWFMFQRMYPFDTLPAEGRRLAWESRPRPKTDGGEDEVLTATPTWQPVGPAPTTSAFANNWGLTSGRINAIAVSPLDPKIVLIGAASGGIWRSIDGGANFTPVSDTQVDLSVASICFSRSNPAIVYAAMGDLYNNYLGTGVLRSTDSGATWTRVSNSTLPAPGLGVRIEVDPTDPQRVYLTQPASLQVINGNDDIFRNNNGFFYSTDGGVNWHPTFFGSVRDVIISPADHNTLYLAVRIDDTHSPGQPGIYKSTDGGLTWTKIYASPYANDGSTRDLRLAVSPANPQKIYAFIGTTNGPTTIKVVVINDNGTSNPPFTDLGATGIDPGQFGYNTYIQVDPTDANKVYVGTRDVYKSINGGQTWASITKNYTFNSINNTFSYNPFNSVAHPDQHSFAFASNDPNTIYIGNDGGLWKSTDGGAHLSSMNATLALSQFVGLVMHPTDATRTYGGTQDNGTQFRTASGNGWQEFAEGDGGHPVVNAPDPSIVFSTYVYGSIRWWRFNADGTRTESGNRRINETYFGESTSSPRIAFYPPFTNNGVDSTLYFGTWRLFISTTYADPTIPISTATTWTAPGGTTDLTKGGTDVLNCIGVAHTAYSPAQVIYTGSQLGRAMVTTNGGLTWTDITTGLPNRSITSIKVDPINPAVAYLTVSGYGTGHVFKTINTGQTWVDISGNLPNIPTSDLLIDPLQPATLYVATDVGVFRSLLRGVVWESFNTGLPPTVVTTFATNASGRIQIGTYGRGAYELTTNASTGPATLQLSANAYSFNEGAGSATIAVTRAGDASSPATVDYRTQDSDTFTVGCADTTNNQGGAYARCDFATVVGTLSFAAGETTKTLSIPIIDDSIAEGPETFQIALSNPSGATLSTPAIATITILDNDTPNQPNPILQGDNAGIAFFVRQQYLDFLSREPEAGEPWSNVLRNCANQFNTDSASASAGCDRIIVSQSFFGSPEFQLKGFYVFRFYKLAFDRLPEYTEITSDMSFVAGSTSAEVFARKAQLVQNFMQRPEFVNTYGALSNTDFVNRLMARYNLTQITTPEPVNPDGTTKVTLPTNSLIASLDTGALTRAQVFRAIADSDQVGAAEFNNAFVGMQYYGYLRRKPDASGYQGWLNYLTAHPTDARTMVNGFLNSVEYRLRFGAAQ